MAERLSAREILARLVGFDSVSRNSNLPLLNWVSDYLAGWGVESHLVHDPTGTKATLFASAGPAVEGGVLLSGHVDVVPVDGQDWTSDPFTLTERDGKLFGRGTCDMKGFDALALWAVPLALEKGVRRPLQIVLSHDEELGCVAPPQFLPGLMEVLPRAQAVIVGEPSLMDCVTGHKGGMMFLCDVHGYEVHSSLMDRGVSAIMEAARLIDWGNAENHRIRAQTPTEMAALFDPPFTTIHTGTIRGGTAANITAGRCRFDFGYRLVAGEDAEPHRARVRARVAEIEAAMKAIRPEAAFHVTEKPLVPALAPEADGAAEALVRAITGDNGEHVVSYGTEAGHFQAAGFSTVVCGPGSIEQAHQADEFLAIPQLEAGQRFMERLVDRLAA